MDIAPGFPAFATAYELGRAQALYIRLIADLETPVSAFLKLGDGRANAFLFESVQGGETRGRYSIIGLKPDLIWRCRDGKAEINRDARADPEEFVPDADATAPARFAQAPRQRGADGAAARTAAHGGGAVRLSRLRHRAAYGEAALAAPGCARASRCDHAAPDHHRHLRQYSRRDHRGDAGLAGERSRHAPPMRGAPSGCRIW